MLHHIGSVASQAEGSSAVEEAMEDHSTAGWEVATAAAGDTAGDMRAAAVAELR